MILTYICFLGIKVTSQMSNESVIGERRNLDRLQCLVNDEIDRGKVSNSVTLGGRHAAAT